MFLFPFHYYCDEHVNTIGILLICCNYMLLHVLLSHVILPEHWHNCWRPLTIWYEKRWPTFCRRHFQMRFDDLKRILPCFKFQWIFFLSSLRYNWRYVAIGSGNDLESKSRIRVNPVHWQKYSLPGLHELAIEVPGHLQVQQWSSFPRYERITHFPS